MFSIFHERLLNEHLSEVQSYVIGEIAVEAEDYILNVNEDEYIDYKVNHHSIDLLSIVFEEMSVESIEKEIPANRHPHGFDVRRGGSFRRTVLRYYIPVEGNLSLLYQRPTSYLMWTIEISIIDSCITFEIVDFFNNPEEIKKSADSVVENIRKQLTNVNNEVTKYNSVIRSMIEEHFRSRKKQLLKKRDIVSQLGVPIRKRESTPKTFSVPLPKVKKPIKISRPQIQRGNFQPDPTLDETNYNSILTIINDVGKAFERMPSTYTDKDEESLRDHILLILEPNFEGSATGETFNKSGKTDILLRHDGNNVFIAECKYWHGEKEFLAAIDQLFNYLTWRDTKTAIILFVRNRDFSRVKDQISGIISKHPTYVKEAPQTDQSWYNFKLHIPDNPDIEAYVAVMLYHVPPVEKA